jgi:hypothetical protein
MDHLTIESKPKRTIDTHLVVQAAAHSAVSTTLFVQELNKVRLLAATFIVDGLTTFGEELYRGERLNAVSLRNRAIGLGVGVNVCNNTLKIYRHGKVQISECNIRWFPGGSP